MRFAENLEENLITIQNELIWKTWEPLPLREFIVHEPKKRLISAPDFRDRVVHHALVRVIEPYFDNAFIYDSHACRKGHGVQLAATRLQRFTRIAMAKGEWWTYKGDIKSYFPSIHHDILKSLIRRKISESGVLWLTDLIIDSYRPGPRGLPIGALTSQLFANIYLDQLDHFVKETLREKWYIRYMDDFVITSNSKSKIFEVQREIESFLSRNLALDINPKSRVIRISIPFCGYRIQPTHILPRKTTLHRAKRRIKKLAHDYGEGTVELPRVKASIASFLGYAKHCASRRTVESVLNEIVLTRSNHD